MFSPSVYVSPIPSGATGSHETWNKDGSMYREGSGGHVFNGDTRDEKKSFDARTTGVRIMEASRNNPARTVYMNAHDQVVNPFTGKPDMSGGHFKYDK